MQATSDVQPAMVEAALKSALIRSFSRCPRPPFREMSVSDGSQSSGLWDLRQDDACLQRVLVQYRWQDVQLDNFRFAGDCLFFTEREDQAEWARWVCDLLSPAGIGYYAPAIMNIVLEEGKAARTLLEWLLRVIDPECAGEDYTLMAFGHWDADQIGTFREFLAWAFEEVPCSWYDGQPQALRSYWENRHILSSL
jgi:hypothetical protein